LCLGIQFASLKGTSLTVVDEKVVGEELVFDGTDRIITPVESFYPCTLEAWISADDLSREQFVIGSDTPSFWGIGIGVKKSNPMVETIKGGFHPPNIEFRLGELTHLAAVFGETEFCVRHRKPWSAARNALLQRQDQICQNLEWAALHRKKLHSR